MDHTAHGTSERRETGALFYGMEVPVLNGMGTGRGGTMKRQNDTRMLLFLMTGTAFLFLAAAVPLSGVGFFLLAQAAALCLGGATLVSLFKRYHGLDLYSAASIYVLYVLMIALFSPGVVNGLAAYLIK